MVYILVEPRFRRILVVRVLIVYDSELVSSHYDHVLRVYDLDHRCLALRVEQRIVAVDLSKLGTVS